MAIDGNVGLKATFDRKEWRFKNNAEQQVTLNNYQKEDAGLSFSFKNGYEWFVNVDNLLEQEAHLYEDVDFVIEGKRLFCAGLRLYTN